MPSETVRPAVPSPNELYKSTIQGVEVFKIFNNVSISYGLPYPEACAKHVEETFRASRVYIISSTTLAERTPVLRDLEAALEGKVVGQRKGLKPHTTWSDVLAIAEDCKRLEADLIITLGGGTLTDAAKLAAMALTNDISSHDEFSKLPSGLEPLKVVNPPTTPIICIPTTLSGGEYTNSVGATDDRTNEKKMFIAGYAVKLLILDANLLTTHTPLHLVLQSGVRSIDHCVEALCSTYCNPATEEHATAGLNALIPGLLRCYNDKAKQDVEARHISQMGVIDAIAALFRVITPAGGSHAIGHVLGPFGVGHGETSCILLPAVCAYNYRHAANIDRQDSATAILWALPEMRALAESKGLKEGQAQLSNLLDALVRGIGMPRTLKEVGVGRDKIEKIAEFGLRDPWCATNPVPLKEKSQILEILESVAE